jgi:hypothetical protein
VTGGFGNGWFNMGYANLTQKMNLHLVTVQLQSSFLMFYVKQLHMVGTLMNNCTTVMKQHCTTDYFQLDLFDLKKAPTKTGMKTNKEEQLSYCVSIRLTITNLNQCASQKSKSLMFQAHKHEISACDL